MPKNAMVSTDIGNVCSVANSYLHFETAPSFLAAMSFGNCGYSYPAAIGAKVGRPDRPAIAYVGDGAWGMSLERSDDLRARKHSGDRGRVQQRAVGRGEEEPDRLFREALPRHEPQESRTSPTSRKRWARTGITVEHVDEIGDALRGAVKSNKPTVINMMLTQELGDPFRRDAFKQPKRLLQKYRKYSAKEFR